MIKPIKVFVPVSVEDEFPDGDSIVSFSRNNGKTYPYVANFKAVYQNTGITHWLKEETKICLTKDELFEFAAKVLAKGVNIAIENVNQPEYDGHFNFDSDNAVQQSKEYISSLNIK